MHSKMELFQPRTHLLISGVWEEFAFLLNGLSCLDMLPLNATIYWRKKCKAIVKGTTLTGLLSQREVGSLRIMWE